MNFRFTVIETSLNRAEFRWKWVRFLQRTALLGIILSLLVLGFTGAVLAGWIASRAMGLAFLALLGTVGFLVWAAILIATLVSTPDRHWLAAAVERIDARLLDRLNTLLFLEKHRGEAPAEAFGLRIARQTQRLLADKPSPPPFSASQSLLWLVAFLALFGITAWVYQNFSPWNRLAAQKVKVSQSNEPEKPLELSLPATNTLESNRPWGEVRITDPGTDLKVTKVDVVPLQIEAAANRPLENVGWFSTVNGSAEAAHELPPPSEPRYAVYKPFVYLDELQLSDWDVMTYYARARTDSKDNYASEVYFLEVQPFREDILKIPGGEGGKAYQVLNELSGLIHRQQHVIRETHQHVQKPPEQERLRNQDRKKLADAENDLKDSSQHLYAKMAADMENKPIGDALDNLAKAQKSLGSASSLLSSNVMDHAQNSERSALSELAAARKMFQKAISDDPSAFADQPQDQEPPPPVADASNKLSQMAEFRNEAKAANDFVRKTLEQQRNLEQQTRSGRRSEYPRLGVQEQQLRKNLEDFQAQHPSVFKESEAEAQSAGQAMNKAAETLQRRGTEATAATQQATQELEKFSQAMQNRATDRQLADAYKLKRMLDRQVSAFDKMSQTNSGLGEAEQQHTIDQTRQTLQQLKTTAEQEPTRDAFGQPLRDALNDQNYDDLKKKLSAAERPRRLDQVQQGSSREQRMGEVKDALAGVSKAFEQSQPKSLQTARKTDSLKPGEQDSLGQGMAELDSLLKQLEENRNLSSEDRNKQSAQALYNLQTGLRSQFGDNDRGNQILLQLKQALEKSDGPDLGEIKKLLEQLQRFSVETSEQLAKEEDQPEVTNIDPARLPPAYRGRIQKYFQKLSER